MIYLVLSESADDLTATAWEKIHQKFDGSESGGHEMNGPSRDELKGPVRHGPDSYPIPVNKFLGEQGRKMQALKGVVWYCTVFLSAIVGSREGEKSAYKNEKLRMP